MWCRRSRWSYGDPVIRRYPKHKSTNNKQRIGDIMNSKYTYFRTLTFKQQKEDDQLYQQLKQKGISTVEALKQVNDNRLGVVL